MSELKPCPHCGMQSSLQLVTSDDLQHEDECDCRSDCGGYFAVICSAEKYDGIGPGGCGGHGGFYETEELAIAAWNNRAPDPQVAQLQEQVRVLREALGTCSINANCLSASKVGGRYWFDEQIVKEALAATVPKELS